MQVLVCVAVILFFRGDGRGHGLWTTLVAPGLAAIGLAGALGLVVLNLDLLAGTSNIVVSSLPYLVVLAGIGGIGFALALKASNPARYAALGKVFEQ